jgi:hypothetical protein
LPAIFAVALTRTGEIDLPKADVLGFAFVWILSAPAAVIMTCYANLFSTIVVSDNYLATRFYFRELKVPWEHIQAIKGLGLLRTRGVLIRVSTSSLPWFYSLYGVVFGQLGGRYIPISSHIENYRGLMEEVRRRSVTIEHH